MKRITSILFPVLFIISLPSCNDNTCKSCTVRDITQEICEDNWKELAARDGVEVSTYELYIRFVEEFGECE